jgi:DNA-binding NarL/FixJ family response regulator
MNTWGLSGVPTDEGAALNDHQRAVLRCLARGLADHEISRVLAVTQDQVAAEVAAILGVLNLRDRMAAVVFAHERGIIRLPLPR